MSHNRTVEIVDYNPGWPALALVESARLANAIGADLIRIEHLGSTSVPGLAAKPVVDLFPVVTSLKALDRRQSAIEELGYLWRGEFGVTGRRFCSRDIAGVRRFHCFEDGTEELVRHRIFRDYLRAHPFEARALEDQKRGAAAAHPDDTLAYNGAKSGWILACQLRANAWAEKT